MRTAMRWIAALVALVVLGGCSGTSKKIVKARAGHPTETATSVPDSTTTVLGGTSASTVTTVAHAPAPATNAATVTSAAPPAGPISTTTPNGPPPDASTGRGVIYGHVYGECGGGNPNSSCQSQQGVGGDAITVKAGDAVAAATRTAADGSYRVEVPAGLYTVHEAQRRLSTRVQVNAGQTVVADF